MKEQALTFRLATKENLPAIVGMLHDDTLGATREQFSEVLHSNYRKAFDIITADPNQELTVAEMNGAIVATFHLTFIQYLTHQGALRAQIEAVRTHSGYRGRGIGKKVFEYAINRAKQKGCVMVQLTTDKKRPDALRFYESIGFVATHEGMKMKL
jgi:GNAT superfamily N-acetyltransferase